MKNLFLSIPLLLCAVSTTFAQQLSEVQLRDIASQQLNTDVTSVRPLLERDHLVAFTGQDGHGVVVISREAGDGAVLGYTQGDVNAGSLPDGLEWWLNATDAALGQRRQQTGSVSFTPVDNFITTTWGQQLPYNLLCPFSGRRTLTGCAATALAQAMKVFNYPEQSMGHATYSVRGGAEQQATLSTTYQWELMSDTYQESTEDSPANTAIAELMRDCGYAVGMEYSPVTSSAYSSNIAVGLTTNFGYDDRSIFYAARNYYSDEEWMCLVYGELANRRPVIYSGIDENGLGHAFVFSGVDDGGRIYVNWGWNGVADGYFDFSNLAPFNIQGVSGTRHYNYDQEMVIGITPTPDVDAMDPVYSQWVSDATTYLSSSSQKNFLKLGPLKFINDHYQPFVGSIDLVFEDNGEPAALINIYTAGETSPVANLKGFSLTKAVYLATVPAGTYHVYMATKTINDSRYRPLRLKNGPVSYLVTKEDDGTVTVSEQQPWTDGIEPVVAKRRCPLGQCSSLLGQSVETTHYRGITIVRHADGSVRKQINTHNK